MVSVLAELLLTLANAIWAAKVLILRQLPLNPYQLTVAVSFVYSWFILPLFLFLWKDSAFKKVFTTSLPLLALLAALEVLAAYWYYLAVKKISPARVGIISLTYTFFLILFSLLVLKERFTFKVALGMALMVVGYLLLVL